MGGVRKGAPRRHCQAYPYGKAENRDPNRYGDVYPPANQNDNAHTDAPTDQDSNPYLDSEIHQHTHAYGYTNQNAVAGIANANTDANTVTAS